MNKFMETLSMALHRERPDETHVAIISNESGDLDSICSSTVLAFHLTEYTDISHIPVMAFNRADLPLRTEALYSFKQQNIDPYKLIFADDIESQENKIVEVVLVDNHHINTAHLCNLEPKVKSIIDHRPWELSQDYYSDIKVDRTLENVGSCATLIAEKIFKENLMFEDKQALSLLRGCILLDTANMSPRSKKVTEKDEMILKEIERRLNTNVTTRRELFKNLENAKEDITGFNCAMLIKKDMKTLNWPRTGHFPIAVSVIPEQSCVSVLLRDDFEEHIKTLTDPWKGGYSLVILLGSGDPYDILLMGTSPNNLNARIVESLINIEDAEMKETDIRTLCNENPTLDHEVMMKHQVAYLSFQNKEYSRKKLMPIIKETVSRELVGRVGRIPSE